MLRFYFETTSVECNFALDIAEGVDVSVMKDIISTVKKHAGASIDSQAIEADANSAVFNMQSVRVGNKTDLKSFAPGIYIVTGKKVLVTK